MNEYQPHYTTDAQYKQRYEEYQFNIRQPVLDIGGGYGNFLNFYKVEKALIIDATKNQNKKYDYLVADLTKKLPEIKTKFKTIFIMETLEHLPNPLYLLAQVYDLLDEDGICYISIPYTEIYEGHHHVCRWTEKEILEQTKKLGFESKVIQKRRRFNNLGFWLPHCWLVLELKKGINKSSIENVYYNNLEVKK